MRKGTFILVALAALALPLSAHAQDASQRTIDKWGMDLHVGGGVGGFTGQSMRDLTGTAGLWDARVAFGTKMPIAVEFGYAGGAQSIDTLGLDTSAVLLSTGLDADIRLQPPGAGGIQPYAFAGVGWKRFDLTNVNTNTSDLKDTDQAVEIPMGVGAAYTVNHFTVDLRGTFRPTFDEGLNTTDRDNPSMHSWNALARLGYRF